MSGAGVSITNANATTDVPRNYEICQRTGFKLRPRHDRLSKIRTEWTGYGVRMESLDMRNAQDLIRSKPERQGGPQYPEIDTDTFISVDVSPDDL